ncbi:hypothetical protein ONA91_09580 [Micromonospora sp. DR5-3]|uniref:hypothetical protein n=1 Tax=unclassified Micromonospora TaxID=2617518 RepID=UPI0011D6DFF4|nr:MULTISPECIES: hypothetical protein [unclassified Micromonospora]MCW3814705.1 hypothetical protein [Micromonospora sp. DR5-3]TYC23494.1 hypothetical protein FXF52_15025 [Micromonospora sp. MP36]
MPDVGPTAVLPRRPLTVGELLDSAVLLLRGQARLLVPLAVLLALGEQALLHPLRALAGAHPPAYWLDPDRLGWYWLLLALGAGTEALIIALLGNPAARGAGAALLGRRAGLRELLRPGDARWGGTLLAASAVGLTVGLAGLAGPAWFVAYGLLGAVVPALVVDRLPGPRVPGRALALAVRVGGRAAGIRLLGYLGWWLIRLGIGLGVYHGLGALGLFDLDAWALPVATAAWVAVNAIAYPALACLDAVLHLETRMRTEGLDIRLSRAPAGTPEPALLAVHG